MTIQLALAFMRLYIRHWSRQSVFSLWRSIEPGFVREERNKNKLDTSYKWASFFFFFQDGQARKLWLKDLARRAGRQEFHACLPSPAPQRAAACGTSETPCAPWHPAKYRCARLCSDRSLHPPCTKEKKFFLTPVLCASICQHWRWITTPGKFTQRI